jgi:hypothetical protein
MSQYQVSYDAEMVKKARKAFSAALEAKKRNKAFDSGHLGHLYEYCKARPQDFEVEELIGYQEFIYLMEIQSQIVGLVMKVIDLIERDPIRNLPKAAGAIQTLEEIDADNPYLSILKARLKVMSNGEFSL